MHIYVYPPIILQTLIYIVTRSLFTAFARLSIHGREHLKEAPKNVIFASNHLSEWDGPLIRSSLPFFSRYTPMYYVARSKKYYLDFGWRGRIYGGLFFRLLGAYPAYSGKKDYAHSLQHHIHILRKNHPVCIFPEGKCSKDGSLGEARGGVAFLAEQSGAMIVPVAISGLTGFSLSKFFLRKMSVSITFGAPYKISSLSSKERGDSEKYKIQAETVMQSISTLLK